MNIVFVCGSLEPGKDGVGDYTRRLSGELIRQGNETSIISLMDKEIKGILESVQYDDETEIAILRISCEVSTSRRILVCKQFIDRIDPDWISLQYVPFAFQSKGLPFLLGNFLKKIGGRKKWHIMFHELWVGVNIEASAKLKLWGKFQKLLIQLLVSRIKPYLIHSHTKIYNTLLNNLGINNKFLPLFSNISVIDIINPDLNIDGESFQSRKVVFFGSIHLGGDIKNFAKEVSQYAKQNNIEVQIVFVGQTCKEQVKWLQIFRSEGVYAKSYGEQPSKFISEILTHASVGVSTTPIALAEKSGSIAAMREHGLPVICLTNSWTFPELVQKNLMDNVFQYSEGIIEQVFSLKKRIQMPSKIQKIANKFVEDLQLKEKHD